MEPQYNNKSTAVKRLMREAIELSQPTDEYSAHPLEDNLFEWHFTMRGPQSSEFEGGIYHGRILLPSEYPMKPPNIILLTPNGRWETNKKICLSISSHHPETWQPSWSIRTALLALIAFMPTNGRGTLGSLEYTPEERQNLAKKSKTWDCENCGKISNLLAENKAKPITKEESELISNLLFKEEDIEQESKQPDKDVNEFSEITNQSITINFTTSNFLKDAICSDVGIYLMYFIITLIGVLVARRFYSV
ncbi:ubiquitin-conjugating enzyme E2 J1-like [Daktulosphaira vitifoliae]|uniref:ubiquitin-conjugating enzyme E2 J1-like n=1 Tax=Daktulosphaira vitifoliae TaxID=58002 RepID=UPI0021AAC1E9|nr:ubiquitin-conjugating enzyme E2 J1-like [Daktulosphaira vitifoliae]